MAANFEGGQLDHGHLLMANLGALGFVASRHQVAVHRCDRCVLGERAMTETLPLTQHRMQPHV